MRNRAEVNERRGCAIALVTRPRRRADVERAGTDAINPRRCGGCSGAITRILTKVDGVNKVEPDLETQKVTVDVADGSGIDGDALLAKLAAWANSAGKKVSVAA